MQWCGNRLAGKVPDFQVLLDFDKADKAQDLIIQVINGTPNAGEESTQNVIVSILSLVNITIILCFMAYHCST